MLFKQKDHKDDDHKCPYVPGQQIPVTTDPGQILHIDSNTTTLLNNCYKPLHQDNSSSKYFLQITFNQFNLFSIKLISM